MPRLAAFIVHENYVQHHAAAHSANELQQAVSALVEEDLHLFDHSVFLAASKNDELVGSAKVTRWTQNIVLPIQTLFKINPVKFIHAGAKSIWHIGRFAVARSEKEGAKLLRQLIAFALYPVSQSPGSILLAECDSRFVKGLNLLGLRTGILAPGIHYLGSETLPIYCTQEWVASFLHTSCYVEKAIDFYQQLYIDDQPKNHFVKKLAMENTSCS